jgi:polysaccharide biosynthesis protein PslG
MSTRLVFSTLVGEFIDTANCSLSFHRVFSLKDLLSVTCSAWVLKVLRAMIALSMTLPVVALSPQLHAQQLLIDNFDRAKSLQRWSFSNGAEFPGASGNLSLGPGHEGHGAVLAYRFTCLDQTHCGHYVAATWRPSSPIRVKPGTALFLWVRLSADVQLTVRITDRAGQTLQFHANARMLEHRTPDQWQPIVVPITGQAAEHWGGANNGQIQDRIVEIAFLADSLYPGPLQGQIAFDDVQLLKIADPTFVLDQAAAPMPTLKDAVGLQTQLGVNIHFLNDDRALDLARDAGFSFVRMDLLWAKLERKGDYDFTPFDRLMRALEARGMGALWLLAYGHPEHGGESPQSKEDIAAYSRYAAAVVSHFRGHNARFEIWNEPNGGHFLSNPAIYPDLLRAALEAIRHEDPDAPVSTGGTSGFDFPFLTSMLNSGSAQKASAIAVHPYRRSGPETLSADLLCLRYIVQQTVGPNLPVWDTEWGYSSYDNPTKDFPDGGHGDIARKREAVLVARECLTVWALGLPLATVYDLRDDGSNPLDREDNFGLLKQDSSDKPAMKAVRILTSLARNYSYSGILRDVPYGLHIMRFDGANDIVFVLWSDDANIQPQIQFSRQQLLSISDMFGEPLSAGQNSIVLEEAMGPVYMGFRRR